MMYRVEFHVNGRGIFPLDMLRYDCCFPANGQSAFAIGENGSELRTVTLVRFAGTKSWEPTNGRWASFGWGVAPNVKVTKI